MKKTIALLLALLMCLSLCACGGKAEAPETAASTTQATTELSTTDATTTLPEETAPQEQVIEISLNNWQDYHEAKEYVSCSISVDAFEEPSNIHNGFYSLLVPKAEIADKIISADVKLKYDADYDISQISWNAKDFTFELLSSREANETDFSLYGHFVREKIAQTMDINIERDYLQDGKKIEATLEVPNALVIENGNFGSNDEIPISSDNEWSETGTGEVHNPVNINITRIEGTLTIAG